MPGRDGHTGGVGRPGNCVDNTARHNFEREWAKWMETFAEYKHTMQDVCNELVVGSDRLNNKVAAVQLLVGETYNDVSQHISSTKDDQLAYIESIEVEAITQLDNNRDDFYYRFEHVREGVVNLLGFESAKGDKVSCCALQASSTPQYQTHSHTHTY